VTYTEPSRYGATDDYFTYGPNVVTYIEDAPAPNYPKQRPFPVQSSFQPNPPRPYTWEYQTGPVYWENQYSRPAATSIGGRYSGTSYQDDAQYEYYEPETFTVVDDDNNQFVYNPYPVSPPTKQPPKTPSKQPPVTTGGRPSAVAPAKKPKPEEDAGYIVIEPEYFDIVDSGDGKESIIYGPNIVRINDDEPSLAASKTSKIAKREVKPQNPELYSLIGPRGESFDNVQPDVTQPIAKSPVSPSFANIFTNPGTQTIK